jgi:[protein-PII] uridylyltransferase
MAEEKDRAETNLPATPPADPALLMYSERVQAFAAAFARDCESLTAGRAAIEARAAAVDALVRQLWQEVGRGAAGELPVALGGIALIAIGGYGRGELFPYSDVDLLFLLDPGFPEKLAAEPVRRLSQRLWDAGLRASAMMRTLADCERFDPENVEFTLALLDARLVTGDADVGRRLLDRVLPALVARERKRIVARLIDVTRVRHQRFGDTLFHLEPNVKECPGGLRDAHVCAWLARLDVRAPAAGVGPAAPDSGDFPDLGDFHQAREFLLSLRTFLHLRHQRDDSVLDWASQDAAAVARLGQGPRRAAAIGENVAERPPDPAFWMRLYFRHARAIARRVSQAIEDAAVMKVSPRAPGLRPARLLPEQGKGAALPFELRNGEIVFAEPPKRAGAATVDAASDPAVALGIFAAIARTGARLPGRTEARLEDALPGLAAQLEDGPELWRHLEAILTGPYAGRALRAMHALGILELVIPEFHGIDALVVRDAYHRYTVDEHTFVVIDTLHALEKHVPATPPTALDHTVVRLAKLLRDLPHRALLFLAALLHDTGKGHAAGPGAKGETAGHALESARLASHVLVRLEFEPYEAGLVVDLIKNHLEMSAALRRDVFDRETVRGFAEHVASPEALRMLTLFTYADIAAVHPGALTPWKAENLWLLQMATANFLDRNLDEGRIALTAASAVDEKAQRVQGLLEARGDGSAAALAGFLEGLPRRYLETRTPEQVAAHLEMALRLPAGGEGIELALQYGAGLSEVTLVTRDRPMLFAKMAGALAGWGMNIITADAFSNAHGIVVDSFRFTDRFRTLELNETERERFVNSLREVIAGATTVESMLAGRKRSKRAAPKVVVETRIDFDQAASSHSTILEVVAQDTPGLLRALAATLAEHGCNIEVALVDTEGEMAIDVFYLTRAGAKLEEADAEALEESLRVAIAKNAA